MSWSSQVRVLIIDDSATVRGVLRAALEADARLAVVGEASDPYQAREMIKHLDPDVLTLDIEKPKMCGLDFLERLMRLRPMPVVVVSSYTRYNSAAAVRALSLGAIECVDLTRLNVRPELRSRLVETLVAAGRISRRGLARRHGSLLDAKSGAAERPFLWNGRIVLIGSSTGGVEALEHVLAVYPALCPPTLVVQHMPAHFLDSFARRLDAALRPSVAIARDGEDLRQGQVLIAGARSRHLVLTGCTRPRTALTRARPGDQHVPSVDALFRSAAVQAGRVIGVILTGMGRDGAQGLMALRRAGARTIAQSAETCVVDGMPGAARAAGAVQESVALDHIGERLLALCSGEEARPG